MLRCVSQAHISPFYTAPAPVHKRRTPLLQEQHAMWTSHKANFSPELEAGTTAEDAARFGKFLGNLKLADARNALEVPSCASLSTRSLS
jgi:hypothetical protein